ncbi:hypothetical protein [Luteolibacter marinus]|uniref:hypothetical protein n=1 Tax=Luteolibacter marinus TaxID=2776705 RepID=UPI0018686378|nr:hypothetical protein [Luteolibacter marinus]
MKTCRRSGHRGNPGKRGFALVASLMLMTLLIIVAVGLLALSSIELRSSTRGQDLAQARANARLAVMMAINQLQMELGPDQRVSAPADLLSDAVQPHWTGVWSTRRSDGSSMWQRDPDTGSLIDGRNEESWDAGERVAAWLVSGEGDPRDASEASVELVGKASAGDEDDALVRVPLVELGDDEAVRGKLAWWTGDLGQRANLGVVDAHATKEPSPLSPANGGYFRGMTSQHADAVVMAGGADLEDDAIPKLASGGTVALGTTPDWARSRFHDYTVDSAGVLADPDAGGLKKDLTAFFGSDGSVAPEGEAPGLSDEDPIFADAADSRYSVSAPRFGALRDWARSEVAFSGKKVATVVPPSDSSGGQQSEEYALCNEAPVQIKGAVKSGLQPVLVEASSMMQISVFQDRTEKANGGGEVPIFQMRQHNYPRVVLWNPYNVELEMQPAIVMIQGNGRQEVWTDDVVYNAEGKETGVTKKSQWLFFEGGRSTAFGGAGITQTEGYQDPYIGSYYYSIPKTTFEPGECLVFSAARLAEYDGLSVYRPGAYDLSKNQLSCEVAPDASRNYYISAAEISGGMKSRPIRFWFDATQLWSTGGRNGIENQSDDTRVVMKSLAGSGPVTFESFDALPQLSYLSGSLQYGAGREPRIAWNVNNKMTVELLGKESPNPRVEPDVRTRDGIRMRWFDEHLSNRMNAGALVSSPQFFEEALLANWNPRAGYAMRSPWENLGGSLPSAGSGGGPWFFGAYTRDLYDQAVSWSGQVPVYRNGRYHGNPFGPPQEGQDRYVVFELPRDETGVVSLGQLQHAKLSEFVWHPSFAVGNSLADPRLGLESLDGTVPPSGSSSEAKLGGFHRNAIGWAKDSERGKGRDEWAETGRALLQGVPDSDNVVYDLSFEVNRGLWDRFYLSSGDSAAKRAFLADPVGHPLPNGRIKLAAGVAAPEDAGALEDFHKSASHLMVDGAFNVNSTRVEAWKAMLAATRDLGGDASPFGRVLNPAGETFKEGDSADGDAAWAGIRALSDDEIGRLAEAIVDQVKLRGPFLSMADFVNRRLRNDPTGRAGALQAAIDHAGINTAFNEEYPLDNSQSIGDYKHPDNIKDATRLEQTLKPASKAWGAPGYLTQGDVLQVLGPALSARSDSFVVRGYGESTDPGGKVLARAWCEVVVQRTPVPLDPDSSSINSARAGDPSDFGRRFDVVSFRWLRPEEV